MLALICSILLSLGLTNQGWFPTSTDLSPAEQLLERGFTSYEAGNYESAEELLKASLELGSSDKSAAGMSLSNQGNAWWYLGLTYEAEVRWEEAADAYRRTLNIEGQILG